MSCSKRGYSAWPLNLIVTTNRRAIRRFTTAVFDLVPIDAASAHQEAPKSDPAYYFRPWKTILVRTVADGGESYVVVTKPAGVVSVKALPDDVEPLQKGVVLYFRSKDRYYVSYLDPGGEQLYVAVDPPKGAVPAGLGNGVSH